MKNGLTVILLFIAGIAAAQSTGIGTISPDASALVDMKSTTKGMLFPRMNIVQRDAIPNPAYGLHVFNTDLNMLEFYDSSIHSWQQYGSSYLLHVTANTTGIQFPSTAYAAYIIVIDSFVTVTVVNNPILTNPLAAIDLSNALTLPGARFIIVNHGAIRGSGGAGGNGGGRVANAASTTYCSNTAPGDGQTGSPAIKSTGAPLTIYNFGTIAGGGGGGGGGKYGSAFGSTGGGGGGGAGGTSTGGSKGFYSNYNSSSGCLSSYGNSNPGAAGTANTSGTGGTSTTGGPGGDGGSPGQAGYTFLLSGYGLPGAGGKAVQGYAGTNKVVNGTYGVVLGMVD